MPPSDEALQSDIVMSSTLATGVPSGDWMRLPRPLNALVGRRPEVAAVSSWRDDPDLRLLTLAGPGGVGKTRLTLAVADEVAGRFADGVRFVDLNPILDS